MAYTLSELVQRVGLEVPPARDELLRWHDGKGEEAFAQIYLNKDGDFFTIEIENNNPSDSAFAPAHVKKLYLQAQKIPGTSGFEITNLSVDGYDEFDLSDTIAADFGLSIAFVSINDIKQAGKAETVNAISTKFNSTARETTQDKLRKMEIIREDNVYIVGNWPRVA